MSNVVVVGAGLAGLAAARRLVAGGHEVTVVEARQRVGGRTEGLVLDDGTPLELGGQWLGEGHTRMHELVGELGLSTFRTWNDEGRLLLELQGRRSTMKPQKGAVPRISPFAVADLAQGLLRSARLAARTDLERPWLTPGAEVLDGQTWESWIRRNLRTRSASADGPGTPALLDEAIDQVIRQHGRHTRMSAVENEAGQFLGTVIVSTIDGVRRGYGSCGGAGGVYRARRQHRGSTRGAADSRCRRLDRRRASLH